MTAGAAVAGHTLEVQKERTQEQERTFCTSQNPEGALMTTTDHADPLGATCAGLLEAGTQLTVRALRDESRVSRDRTAAYLGERANGHRDPPIPAEQLTGGRGPAVGTEATAPEQTAALDAQLATVITGAERTAAAQAAENHALRKDRDRLTADLNSLSEEAEKLQAEAHTECDRAGLPKPRPTRCGPSSHSQRPRTHRPRRSVHNAEPYRLSIRSFGGHPILGPEASDIASGGQQWCPSGPLHPIAVHGALLAQHASLLSAPGGHLCSPGRRNAARWPPQPKRAAPAACCRAALG